MSDAFEMVRDRLHSDGSKITNNRQNHFMAQCPAHEDKNPSLEVIDKGDKVILCCYAGCQTDDVVAALGMEWKDLFENEAPTIDRGQLVRSYLYVRPNGEPWFFVDRYFPKTFRQRMPDVEPVRDLNDKEQTKRLGLRKRPPILYGADILYRAMLDDAKPTVYFLDGEKDVETARRHGGLATCPPGFAKWNDQYALWLKDAGEIVIVADQDVVKKDGSLGAGQANAVVARNGFRSAGLPVRVVSPAAGKDLTDHFTAGYDWADFVPEPTIYTRPRGLDAADLMTQAFAPIKWAIEGVVAEGLTILAGAPKVGKSWVALDMAASVAAGGPALSALPTCQGSVLYLAREDSFRRLQGRLRLLMGTDKAPEKLELIPADRDWVGGEEGLANMSEWADEVKDPRLVILDTLQRVESNMGEDQRRGVYASEYDMMARYKHWADRHHCSVMVIHHDRKGADRKDPDWMSRISGTRGLTGAADGLMFLERDLEDWRLGTLHVSGRDVAEQSLGLHKTGPLWLCTDRPEGVG